ncbi:MAG: hypothetical protein HC925_07725 [Coleofasciculaceae cyanobacterium SM2_3_26]|nr:hypothetical protein [Coleofasciculaceae cyanobacterium SM2_3_26]
MDEYTPAIASFQSSLFLFQQLGDEYIPEQLELLRYIGVSHLLAENYASALAFLERGLELANELGDRETAYRLLLPLTYAAYNVGDYDRAILYAREALTLVAEFGDPKAQRMLQSMLLDAEQQLTISRKQRA